MIHNENMQKVLFYLFAVISVTPFVSTPLALVMGIFFAVVVGHPFPQKTGTYAKLLLKLSIVGLGFGMSLDSAVRAGREGFFFTVFTIVFVLILGRYLGRWFKTDQKTSYLVSSGTAICGGSAIAAIAGTIDADERQISVALGTVFLLNSVALIVFPGIGHWLELSQTQFGIWSAIAIHDTSSVVGAAHQYGEEALELAVTIKLGRALWIIPLSIATVYAQKGKSKKTDIPYFIVFFILSMTANTFLSQNDFLQSIFGQIVFLSRKALILTLFLIGTGLSFKTIQRVGVKVLLQGIILWVSISILVLIAVLKFY